jgi:hypothetical protein
MPYALQRNIPPDASMRCPLIQRAPSDSSAANTGPISSGTPTRPSAVCDATPKGNLTNDPIRENVPDQPGRRKLFVAGLGLAATSLLTRVPTRWKHEDVLEEAQHRLDRFPDAMRIRRDTVEHPFGTLKLWMGSAHFLTKTLKQVSIEMSLHVLAYNLKRVMKILGIETLRQTMKA